MITIAIWICVISVTICVAFQNIVEYCLVILSLWQYGCFWVRAAEPGKLVFVSGVHSGLKRGFWSRMRCVRICFLPSLTLWRKSLYSAAAPFSLQWARLQLRGQVWLASCQECVFRECVWISWLTQGYDCALSQGGNTPILSFFCLLFRWYFYFAIKDK